MTTMLSGYVGRLTALSANDVPTEQAGTGYARAAVTISYDPVANVATILDGYTFENTGGSAWTVDTYEAVWDASSGGNMLMVYPVVESAGLAAGDTISLPALQTISHTPFTGGNGVLAQGGTVGLLNGAAAVTAGVAIQMVSSIMSAQVATPAVLALTFASTLNTNCALAQAFSTTLTGNMTLANPTNAVAGQTYRWFLKQDATGSRTLTLGSAFKTAGGAPTLTTTASATDRYSAYYDGTTFWGTLDKAFA
jgi:hypothetical protein